MAKCAECGFLALRLIDPASTEPEVRPSTLGLVEADEVYRSTGIIPHVAATGRNMPGMVLKYARRPVCFVQADDYSTDRISDADDTLALLRRDRPCEPTNTPWRQGFSPKEHQEMLDRERTLKWQADREDADRDWRAEQDRLRDERQGALLWQ